MKKSIANNELKNSNSKLWQCYCIEIVSYFVVATLFYLIFVLLDRFGVLSWSLASPVWGTNLGG